MNEDIEIIKKSLPDMARILNAIPGERFDIPCSQTLLILSRRMDESELLRHLQVYTGLFTKEDMPGVIDLSNAAVAFVKIKTLAEADRTDFDQLSIRKLCSEFISQKTKVMNIIRLSRVNALAADEYQKEVISKTLDKSERYLKAFESEIAFYEKQMEKEPEVVIKPKEEVPDEKKEAPKPKEDRKNPLKDVFLKALKFVKDLKGRKEVGNKLKEEEAKHSDSRCEEIPFYDKSLRFDESFICKDIPEFSVFLRKDNAFFGLTKNAKGGMYDNRDKSLYELLKAGKDFLQFLSCDLLTGEYDLKPFSEEEKEGMRLYFNFICSCFEKHIGKTLSVKEYLSFKDYYNKLMLISLGLDKNEKDRYYRALQIADEYISYMKGYDLYVSDDKDEVISNILSGKSLNYVGDLELILSNHVVFDGAKKELLILSDKIKGFDDVEEAKKQKDPEIDLPFIEDVRVVVTVLGDDGKALDAATFSADNFTSAAEIFLRKDAPIKKLSVERESETVDLFVNESGKVTSLAVPGDVKAISEDELDRAKKALTAKFNQYGGI